MAKKNSNLLISLVIGLLATVVGVFTFKKVIKEKSRPIQKKVVKKKK